MQIHRHIRKFAGELMLGAGLILIGLSAHGDTPPPEWPRVFFRDGVTNTIYQPQLESWDYFTMKVRSAVSIQPKGAAQATFGTIVVTAQTQVDRAERQVYLSAMQITDENFPSAGTKEAAYLATLRSLLPKSVKSISLDRLEANLAILEAREKSKGQPLKNDPPLILFSQVPAMLILVDGPAEYRPVDNTSLDRVLNTRALILRDKDGTHYLHLFDGYVQAPALGGPWKVAKTVPSDVTTAETQSVKAKQVDLLAGQKNPDTGKFPSLKSTPVPKLYVLFNPAELITTDGVPKWTAIPSTQLLCATNTIDHLFRNLVDQRFYVLLSGRWFRSTSFNGPWEYVGGANLPQDFANIPDDDAQENVKAAVPGTHQAEECAIANSIPNMVKVERAKAKLDPAPAYDGSPKLQAIEGTSLYYVVNCPMPVIRVDTNAWYTCQNGIWYVSTSTLGPWALATSVPAVIYSIPPSSPVHYVVYSRIYNYDATYVWVGTTPGYYGTIVGPDGVVVYGTGYDYPAYVGSTVYVAYPVTYGYASNPCWTPWAGWSFGFAVCWAANDDWEWWCGCPPAPYWGPYYYPCYGAYYNAYGGVTAWGPYGWAGTTGYIYHQNGSWSGVSRGAAGYNAWTGNEWATQYGRAYNSTTGTSAVGQRGAVQNVYTGNYAYGARGAAYNSQTGAAAAGSKVTIGNENTGNSVTAGRGAVYNPNTGNTTQISGIKGDQAGAINVNGNVIVGKDGNYYRPNGSGGWEQLTKPPGTVNPQAGNLNAQQQNLGAQQRQWQSSNASQQQLQSLNREYNAQNVGAQRQQSFQANRPAFRSGGGGGGGFRGRR